MNDENQNFDELEEQLARLMPQGPEPSYLRALGRHLDSLEEERRESEAKKIVWVRFAPLAAAACIALGLTIFIQTGDESVEAGAVASVGEFDTMMSEDDLLPIASAELLVPEFPALQLPNSYLGGSSDGLVQVSAGATRNSASATVSSWTIDVQDAEEFEREHDAAQRMSFIIPTEADGLELEY